jgi:predicted phage replisome organizer
MNLSFIKLDINIMNDTKIKLIRKMPDGDKILVLWIGLLCLGMKSGKPGMVEIGDGIPFTSESLSIELDIPINTVKLGLKTFVTFKMVEIWEGGETVIVNFEKHQALGKIKKSKESSKKSSQIYRDRLKLEQRDRHVTNRDETDKERDKEKEIERDVPSTPLTAPTKFKPEITKFVNNYQGWALIEHGNMAEPVTDLLITNCSDVIDKLIRLDGFTQEDVFNSIEWASNDDFWSKQIKSLAGLRRVSKNKQMKFKNMFSDFEDSKNSTSTGCSRTDHNIKVIKSWGERKKREMEANGE